ncbi:MULTISPECIES: hypothetical protein [unclassified Pseudomonas]|uniref:hypothetical protein n=1 Tax=unclassified Pseudomonas TaxID=196821 RepID=UPI0035C00FDB
MALKITSSDNSFNAYIDAFQHDDNITPLESIKLRKSADEEMDALLENLKVHVNEVLKKEQKPDLDWPLKRLQMLCDLMVEDLQYLAKAARSANLDERTLKALRSAIEHQLAYVVFGHNASVNRLKAQKKAP